MFLTTCKWRLNTEHSVSVTRDYYAIFQSVNSTHRWFQAVSDCHLWTIDNWFCLPLAVYFTTSDGSFPTGVDSLSTRRTPYIVCYSAPHLLSTEGCFPVYPLLASMLRTINYVRKLYVSRYYQIVYR